MLRKVNAGKKCDASITVHDEKRNSLWKLRVIVQALSSGIFVADTQVHI